MSIPQYAIFISDLVDYMITIIAGIFNLFLSQPILLTMVAVLIISTIITFTTKLIKR